VGEDVHSLIFQKSRRLPEPLPPLEVEPEPDMKENAEEEEEEEGAIPSKAPPVSASCATGATGAGAVCCVKENTEAVDEAGGAVVATGAGAGAGAAGLDAGLKPKDANGSGSLSLNLKASALIRLGGTTFFSGAALLGARGAGPARKSKLD